MTAAMVRVPNDGLGLSRLRTPHGRGPGSPQGAAADSYLVDPAKGGFPPPRLLHLGLLNEYERAA